MAVTPHDFFASMTIFFRFSAAIPLIALGFSLSVNGSAAAEAISWKRLEPGLSLAEPSAPVKSTVGNSRLTVLRIDMTRFALKLITASETGSGNKSPKAWSAERGLIAAVNAGLYARDRKTAVGLMRNYRHVNNARLVRRHRTVFAFNRRSRRVPRTQIIDLTCQKFARLRRLYNTLIQGIRMIDCRGRNTWSADTRTWSMAAAAMDKRGRVLLAFTRSPYAVRDFITILKKLPLRIRNAMYLEGGPVASLYIKAGGVEIERVGHFRNVQPGDVINTQSWPVPNVIGVVRRSKRAKR